MKMHYCTCRINLAGQGCHIVEILATEPMTWPEVQIMFAMHGDENVYDIKPIAIGDSTPMQEKRRLGAKYRGKPIVEQVFPGRSPQMEMLMPGEPDTQPAADEYGVVLQPVPAMLDDSDVPVPGGLDPPTGPAVFRPVGQRRSLDGPPGAS